MFYSRIMSTESNRLLDIVVMIFVVDSKQHSLQAVDLSQQTKASRRANTCDPALKLLNEEITYDIQKHKQNIWKEHLDAH